MKISIRTRLAITFVALAASLLIVVGAVLAWQSYLSDQRQAVKLQNELASRISTQVVSYMQIQENSLKELIQVRGLSELDHDQQTNLLTELLSFTDAFDSLTLLGRNGLEEIVVSHTNIADQLGDRSTASEFTVPKTRKQIYYSTVQFDENTGEPFLFISVPTVDVHTGAVTSVLVANVRFKPIWDLLASMQLGEESSAYIVDTQNRVIAHNNPSIVLRNTLFTPPDQDGTHIGVSGNNVVLATNQITLGDQTFTIVAETSTSEAFAGIIRTELTIALLLLVSIALAGGLGWFAARQIVEPIEVLATTAERVTAGDLSQKASIKRLDEIGTLGHAFNTMTSQLQDLIGNLEQRVAERTNELESANQQIERRAEQFEAIAQVSRIISTVQRQEELLPRITHTISHYFGFYHAGIFLLDENKQFAVLRAANSVGGKRMLARHHRLEIGQTGIVGYVTATGNPRIALDVGADAVFFDNPDLPDTRSEMALPLKSGGKIIGALDVQSTEPNAFTQEDINILSTLAEQVSVAIQNALLFEESRKALAQVEAAYRQMTSQTWTNISRFAPVIGYHFDGTKSEPLTQPTNGRLEKDQNEALSVPVKLRNETIGRLHIKANSKGHQWTEDEIAIVRATAERVALAAENARLVLESQKKAAKEQVIGEISSKIGASINLDNILQTTLREMGRILPGAEISIQVENERMKEA
jgi:GAF domain-containing protein/HAMP domain-containing protein